MCAWNSTRVNSLFSNYSFALYKNAHSLGSFVTFLYSIRSFIRKYFHTLTCVAMHFRKITVNPFDSSKYLWDIARVYEKWVTQSAPDILDINSLYDIEGIHSTLPYFGSSVRSAVFPFFSSVSSHVVSYRFIKRRETNRLTLIRFTIIPVNDRSVTNYTKVWNSLILEETSINTVHVDLKKVRSLSSI